MFFFMATEFKVIGLAHSKCLEKHFCEKPRDCILSLEIGLLGLFGLPEKESLNFLTGCERHPLLVTRCNKCNATSNWCLTSKVPSDWSWRFTLSLGDLSMGAEPVDCSAEATGWAFWT